MPSRAAVLPHSDRSCRAVRQLVGLLIHRWGRAAAGRMFAVARRDTGYENSPQSLRTGAVGLVGQKDRLISGFVGGKQLGIDKKGGKKLHSHQMMGV